MKEIGGYFGLEQLIQKEYYPNLIALNNARSALLYLLKTRKIKKLYIPYFLCDSVSGICDREGYSYSFYSIDQEFYPVFDGVLKDDEYLYIVNYYGQISDTYIHMLKQRFGNIILDNVQAFFRKPINSIDTIYSCRKFFGVPDGAYLATTALFPELLPEDQSKDRMKHILGRFDDGIASAYYSDFKANDHMFRDMELRSMSAITHNLLGAVDYETVRRKREENFVLLNRELRNRNVLSINITEGPYAYPFYCKNGMEVKKKLTEKKIYVPTLWPNVLKMEGTLEKDYAENILPLPCDQRYDAEDMERIVEEVLKCIV